MPPSKHLGALTVEDRAKLEQRLASQSVGPMLYLRRPIGPGASEGRGNSTSITSTHWPWTALTPTHGTGTRARRLQDIESDTGYDPRRRVPGGVLAGVSHTAVYDTC